MGYLIAKYWFWISLLVLALIYYFGLTTDLKTVIAGFVQADYAVTGRDSSGHYQGYPSLNGQPVSGH